MPVVVIVEEPRGDGPSAGRNAGLFGDVGERAVTVVVIQRVVAVAGHIQVGEAVVVIVGCRDAHSVIVIAGVLKAGLGGNVSKTAVAILLVEAVPVARFATQESGYMSAIYKEYIQ